MKQTKSSMFLFILLCLNLGAMAQATPDFSASSYGSCSPATISFTNSSSGATRSFYWTFGNGQSSLFIDPSTIYSSPGKYPVKLTAIDTNGVGYSITKYITIYKDPRPKFIANTTTICERTPINFTSQSAAGDTAIAGYVWDFGDGFTSYAANPQHSYTNASTYTVKLLVTDYFGCTADTQFTNYITIKDRPQANFTFPATRVCKAPVSITFTNLTNPTNTSFAWTFGDGSTSTANSPSHTYANLGKYEVGLIATQTTGCADTVKRSGDIDLADLVVDFKVDKTQYCQGDSALLTQNISPKLTTTTVYIWKLPNGQTIEGETVKVKLDSGYNAVKLNVSNAQCSGTITKNVYAHPAPSNRIIIPNHVLCGTNVYAQYSLDTAGIDSFKWRVNNQYNRSPITNEEFFDTDGEHYIQLFLRDRKGCTALYKDTFYASAPKFYSTNDTGACIPFSFKPSYSFISSYGIDSVFWQLEDFGIANQNSLTPPQVSVTDTGYYYLNFTVTDSIGCTVYKSIQVGGGYKPTASYSLNKTSFCNRDSIVVENTSTGSILPNRYLWIFGSARGETKKFTWLFKDAPAEYNLLHIASHYGCNDSIEDVNKFKILGPYADYYFEADTCINSYRKTVANVIEADSFWFVHNSDTLGQVDSFFKTFSHFDTLKLVAQNNTTGCVDSFTTILNILGDAKLDWEIFSEECAPAEIFVKRKASGMDSTKLYINNVDIQSDDPEFKTKMYQGGSLNLKLRGFAAGGCNVTLDTTIIVNGPKVKPIIGQSFGCFPKTYTLIDSFWSDTFGSRSWIIDGDTIPSDSLSTKYVLKGLKNPTSNIVTIKLMAGNENCYSSSQFNFLNSGVRFTTVFNDSIIDCTESKYKFNILVDVRDTQLVDKYYLEYRGFTESSSLPEFYKNLVLDGSVDTAYLTVRSKSGCNTTQKLILNKPKPALKAKFSSSKSAAGCPPLLVDFKDESSSLFGKITSREWSIDSQFFSVLERPSRVFSEPGVYKIKLIVTDERGCVDSITTDSFVKIKGEKVDIDFGDSAVCESLPLKVKIISGNAIKYEWDMGNGNVVLGDSVSYVYSSFGKYLIKVLVTDSNCKYPIFQPDSVSILRKPIAQFNALSQCKNQPNLLVDQSQYFSLAAGNKWFSQNVTTTNQPQIALVSALNSETVKLIISDTFGCRDSVTKILSLHSISADFSLDKSYYCQRDSAVVLQDIVSDTTVASIKFSLDGFTFSPSTTQKLKVPTEGIYSLKMVATNAVNCKDSAVKNQYLKVVGPNVRSNTAINFLSVGQNNEVFFTLTEDTTGYFKEYQLLNRNQSVIWQGLNVNKTTGFLTGLNPNLDSVCLFGGAINGCETSPIQNMDKHCTINVYGQKAPMARLVQWTPYVGWDNVGGYSIYREEAVGYKLLASVPGDGLSYLDRENINCDKVQKYRVAAYGKDISYSDTCHLYPDWTYSVTKPEITSISVLENKDIEFEISEPNSPLIPIEKLQINRTDWVGNTSQSTINFATYTIDNKVNVQSGAYFYTVQYIDECELKSEPSDQSHSIHLRVETDVSGYPKLTWTQAEMMISTFVNYQVLKKVGTDFIPISTIINRTDTQFIDRTSDIECADNACYLVIANSTNYASKSNENCTGTISRLYAPNAVTPNDDGLNDTYNLRGLYIAQYNLQIYSRWGELIWETNQCMQPWDCMINGEKAPDGVYVYVVSAVGADRVKHSFKGTIHVFR